MPEQLRGPLQYHSRDKERNRKLPRLWMGEATLLVIEPEDEMIQGQSVRRPLWSVQSSLVKKSKYAEITTRSHWAWKQEHAHRCAQRKTDHCNEVY